MFYILLVNLIFLCNGVQVCVGIAKIMKLHKLLSWISLKYWAATSPYDNMVAHKPSLTSKASFSPSIHHEIV